MKTIIAMAAVCAILFAAPAGAVPAFFDNFENGVSGSVWTKWTGSNQEILQSSSSHNITPAGSRSALAVTADPTGYSAYADFGTFGGFVRAEVWVFEDKSYTGTQPVTNMLCLVGDTGGSVGFGADYLQLGMVPFWPTAATGYGFRTAYNDANALGIGNANVARKSGWTNFAIEADALSAGGQVRFFIDGNQVGTSKRTAANLRWVRLGNNSKSYENFWYDDVRVVPEPASILALAGGLASMGMAIRRRKA